MAGTGDSLDVVTHVIQTALTPVFLLSGIGTLLNTFNTRLSRVADHHGHISELWEAAEDPVKAESYARHLVRLRRRRSALDTSVILGAVAGAATCGAAFTLFVGSLRSEAGGALLLWLFGGALGTTIAALTAFLVDTVLAWHGIRRDGPLPRQPSRAPL